jgi:hypothetical protein
MTTDDTTRGYAAEVFNRLDLRAQKILNAAQNWFTAHEAVVAAQTNCQETGALTEAADIAGTKLVLAVASWNSGGAA